MKVGNTGFVSLFIALIPSRFSLITSIVMRQRRLACMSPFGGQLSESVDLLQMEKVADDTS